MPTIFVKLKLTENDSGSVKGEELDEAVQEAIEGIEIDGYDTDVSVSRQKQTVFPEGTTEHLQAIAVEMDDKSKSTFFIEADKRFLNKIAVIISGVCGDVRPSEIING